MTQHFKERMRERFNIRLTKKQQKTLVNQIKSGSPRITKVGQDAHGMANLGFYHVRFGDQYMKVLYDSDRETLVTVIKLNLDQVSRSSARRRMKKREDRDRDN